MDNLEIKETKSSKALKKSLRKLLSEKSFDKITVNDLCQDAEVSRTAFYQNFLDKYDLLSSLIKDFNIEITDRKLSKSVEYIEYIVDFTLDNKELLKNLLITSNEELTRLHIESIKSELSKY